MVGVRLVVWAMLLAALTLHVVQSEDTERILIEDISDDDVQEELELERAQQARRRDRANKFHKARDQRESKRTKEEKVPTVAALKESIKDVERLLDRLDKDTQPYKKDLLDADHIEKTQKQIEEVNTGISKAYVAALRGVKTDAKAYQPLADKSSTALHKRLSKIRGLVNQQIGMHLNLMQQTAEVIPYDPLASKALKSYIKLRIKRQKPSSSQNIREMMVVQRRGRGNRLLGLTNKELLWITAGGVVPFVLFMIVSSLLFRYRLLRHRSRLFDTIVVTAPLVLLYPSIIGPALMFLERRHFVYHAVLGLTESLVLYGIKTAVDNRILRQVEQDKLEKRRRLMTAGR